jgi:FKBP-type peptidyl-prolyl cis-trans isomerase 2
MVNALRSSASDTKPQPQQQEVMAEPEAEKTRTEASVPFKVMPKNSSPVSDFTTTVINKVLDNPHGRVIFEDIVNKMVTNYHGALGEDIIHKEYIVKDVVQGSGNIAACGDLISISYTTKPSGDKNTEKITPTHLLKEITIGKNTLNKSLENGLIGMQENGQRKIIYNDPTILENNSKDNKKDFLLADVTLLKITKKNKDSGNWGVFVDKDTFALIGPKIMCGDEVQLYYTIRDMNGKTLHDSNASNEKITFEIGGEKTPQRISNGLMGLVKDKSKISVILDKKEMQYKDKNGVSLLPKKTSVSPNNLLIVDFYP